MAMEMEFRMATTDATCALAPLVPPKNAVYACCMSLFGKNRSDMSAPPTVTVLSTQRWVDSTVTVGGADMSDLFFPNNDIQQAYTAFFGGTSGASAQVASVVAILNSISIAMHQSPYPPNVFRDMLIDTALPTPESEIKHLGGQPHIGTFLEKYAR